MGARRYRYNPILDRHMEAAASLKLVPHTAAAATNARQLYAACVAGIASAPSWWTAVVVTASSNLQAERYEVELQRRRYEGKLPPGVRYIVVPDPGGRRVGSGGATLNALRALATDEFFQAGVPASMSLADWWSQQRVLIVHSGGDSRRLPQYSVAGKLFCALPTLTPWGDPAAILDETLALSTAWVSHMRCGLLVASGDVVLTFEAAAVDWERDGVSGVGMIQPLEVGAQHGVYVTDRLGHVASFLQKPSRAEVAAAGALMDGDSVALDTGLLRFAPGAAARLMGLALDPSLACAPPLIDLYQHVTMALTGQWAPGETDPPVLRQLFQALEGLPFWCSVVAGDFTHIGTTSLFRRLLTQDSSLSPNRGAVIDSVLPDDVELPSGAVVVECNLLAPLRAAPGSVLHGVEDATEEIRVPPDTVIHQLPVRLPNGRRGVVLRVYGVDDNPKAELAAATWFGRPLLAELRHLGLDPELVWPSVPAAGRTLWNACLYPAAAVEEAWRCARWMFGHAEDYSVDLWARSERLSLATSTLWADGSALERARARRGNARWRLSALSLVNAGADIRPLLAHAPSTEVLAETGEAISASARSLEDSAPTESASRYYTAGLFFARAGLVEEADKAHAAAFDWVRWAVEKGTPQPEFAAERWQFAQVSAEAPARIDLGGGWSDTPPFCLDWGGAVLNVAVLLNGAYPIRTTIRRLAEPVVRCFSGETGAVAEYRTFRDILHPPLPGDEFSIPRTALRVAGVFREDLPLRDVLQSMGGGIEIRTEVNLPMGSGLGTSSILAATTVRALLEMMGIEPDTHTLLSGVMRLEQLMTTGGGWQDQAGGGFPGAKLLISGPGLRQCVRFQPVVWPSGREAEFQDRLVLYYTGIRRVARKLLREVVGRYLRRETSAVQVLHSIKTLAIEMSFAMQEGDWEHLGALLDRHWKLNQILDPHTTNAPIEALLERVRPYIHGAKLAGAGGGGFLILVARSPEKARELRLLLDRHDSANPGAAYDCHIAKTGLRVERE